MKLNPNYKLRTVAGETIVVRQGTPDVDLTRIISLNESSRTLWQQLAGKDFTPADVADALCATYGIPRQQALTDAENWVGGLKKCGCLQED
jgi:hypothetical protein